MDIERAVQDKVGRHAVLKPTGLIGTGVGSNRRPGGLLCNNSFEADEGYQKPKGYEYKEEKGALILTEPNEDRSLAKVVEGFEAMRGAPRVRRASQS